MLYFGRSLWLKSQVYALRQAVFVEEQKIPAALEFDHLDQTCPYYLWMVNDQPIATVRYQFERPKILQPDRLCVASDYRHQGYGQQLLSLLEERGLREGAVEAILSAEISASAFYLACGYHICSTPFLEDGLPCVKMTKTLK